MNKKIYYFFVLLLGISFSFVACVKHDNDSDDEEWRAFQDAEFLRVSNDKANFTELASQTGNGSVYWQKSSVITDSDLSTRITSQGMPEFTDTVVVRYEGWYYNLVGKKFIFDSTENPSLSNSSNPNRVERQFAVSGVINGWTTILQNMRVGEERLVVIPQQLGYGGATTQYIPAYTTLWFRIKLFRIIPMQGRS